MGNGLKFTTLAVFLIIVLGFAVYANTLNGKFIADDIDLVKNNVYIKSYTHIAKIFCQNIAAGAERSWNSYRPFQMLTFMLDYALWKLNVQGYHLTNILLHISVAVSIFWLINILYDNRLLSLFTSLLFVVHPIHTEAVAYISGRADSLAALFMLLSIIFYIKHLHLKKINFYIFSLLMYIFALLSRENSLILPMILPIYHYTFKKRFTLLQFLPIFGITFIYILLRVTVLKSLLFSIVYPTTLLQRIPGFFVAITNYTKLILIPFHLHMEYGNNLFSFTHLKAVGGIIIVIFLLIYALRERKSRGMVFFSLCWFFITLLPQSNLYPVNAFMAEHWLYLPSIGFFLILSKGLTTLYTREGLRKLALILVIGLLSFYSYLTLRQNGYWKGPMFFYERTLKYAPNNLKAHNNLGEAYSAVGRQKEAIDLFKKAIAIKPNFAPTYSNLANAYSVMGRQKEAIPLYKKAIAIDPNFAQAYYNLANAYYDIDRKKDAVALYKKAIAINPDYARAYYNLANTYQAMGREEAIPLYKKAIAIDPNFAQAYHNLSVSYLRKKEYKLAIEYCEKARELGFTKPDLLEALGPYRE